MTPRIEDWTPHLGRKVSMRYKLDDPEHPFSEAIGVVAAVDTSPGRKASVTILTRSGDSKTVAVGDIVAAKLFPL